MQSVYDANVNHVRIRVSSYFSLCIIHTMQRVCVCAGKSCDQSVRARARRFQKNSLYRSFVRIVGSFACIHGSFAHIQGSCDESVRARTRMRACESAMRAQESARKRTRAKERARKCTRERVSMSAKEHAQTSAQKSVRVRVSELNKYSGW